MGSFAGLLKAAGYSVRGSDENVYPPMSDKLKAWGIEVLPGYSPENLEPAPDLVVVGNVIRRTNPEAQAVLERKLNYTSFPKALGELFLADKHSIVVSGTHGKTTTTSLIAWLLSNADMDPGMLVGGVPGNFDEGFRLGRGEHFVVEGDEYDTAFFDKVPKFVHYQPKTAIITSLEFDHADIYPDVETIERQFDRLVGLVPEDGTIYVCADAPRALKRTQGAHAKVITYSASGNARADWKATGLTVDESGSRFLVFNGNIRLGRFFIPMAGQHNVENALVAIAVSLACGLSVAEVQDGLTSFKGIARRQTIRAEIDGVRIIDDFAHHPTAVKATVAAIRERYPKGRLFAIFEPRTATSSRKYFQNAYAEAFDGASETVIAQVGRSELPESERLDVVRLTAALQAKNISARQLPDVDAIVAYLAAESRSEDTLLFMSNGGFGGIYEKIETALQRRSAPAS